MELPLNAGDRVLLYTDGIPETTNPEGIEFGTDRFRRFLEAEQSISADELVDRLLEALSRWAARGSGEELDDDITIVAIDVKND